MLFMIIHRHTAEMCPGGNVKVDRDWLRKIKSSFRNSDIKFLDGYSNAPDHEFFFLVESNNAVALTEAVDPLRKVGSVKIIPVLRFEELENWAAGAEIFYG